jgi:hypothetical protein
MSTTTQVTRRAVESPARKWTTTARVGAAVSFTAAGLLWVIGDVIGFGLDGPAQLRWIAANPTLSGIGLTADMLAVPFLTGAVLAWLLLARARSPRLAIVGSIMLVFGLTGQSIANGEGGAQYQIMTSGRISAVTLFNAIGSGPVNSIPGIALMLMFYVGAFAGIIVLMIALWRSRTLPRVAVALVIAFQLAGFVPVAFPTTVLAAAGLIWMAVSILRSGSQAAVRPDVK